MSDPTMNNKNIIPQTQMPQTGVQNTGATQQTPSVEEPLFGGNSTTATNASVTNTASAPVGDQYVPSSEVTSEELREEKAGVDNNNAQLEVKEGETESTITDCENTITEQTANVDALNSANAELKAANATLASEIAAGRKDIYDINTQIKDLNAQIEANSGFTGGLLNALKGVIGKGVDVGALKGQVAQLEAQKKEIENSIKEKESEIDANEKTIADNESEITNSEGIITDTEATKETQEGQLEDIQAEHQDGVEKSADLQEEIEAKEIEEAQEAESKASEEADPEKVKELQQNDLNDIKAAYEAGQITYEDYKAALKAAGQEEYGEDYVPDEDTLNKQAGVLQDTIANGDITTDTIDDIKNENYEDAYIEAGFTPEEARERIEIVEAITTYQAMGIDVAPEIFESKSVQQLDEIIETAMVQDTIKASSTKIVGNAANFTSKKDMQANADSVDEFIDTYSALQSYYQSNDVEDLEVNAYLNTNSDKLNKISQGYIYETSKLQELSNSASTLMTTLKTRVSLDEAAGASAGVRFEEARHKTEGAIDNAEGKLNKESEDSDTVDQYRTEFLNLTNKFNNSDTDSARQMSIKAMERLYERALNADENTGDNPYRGKISIAA